MKTPAKLIAAFLCALGVVPFFVGDVYADVTMWSSGDCKALAVSDASYCTTNDCKGIVKQDASYCQSDDCKAWAKKMQVIAKQMIAKAL